MRFNVGDRVRVRLGMSVLPEKGTVTKIDSYRFLTVILDEEPDYPRYIDSLDVELVSIVEQVADL